MHFPIIYVNTASILSSQRKYKQTKNPKQNKKPRKISHSKQISKMPLLIPDSTASVIHMKEWEQMQQRHLHSRQSREKGACSTCVSLTATWRITPDDTHIAAGAGRDFWQFSSPPHAAQSRGNYIR